MPRKTLHSACFTARNSFVVEPEIVAQFNGEMITSDAGVLLLREASQRLGLISKFAECFDDFRNPDQTDHPLEQLLAQRIFGITLGF